MTEPHSQIVATNDGRAVAASFFAPAGEAKGSVLLVGAMGVNQDYYRPIASWLAEHGYLAATFDFFGTGKSLQGNLRDVDVNILQWAQQDCPAMVEALCTRLSHMPLYWIGHSLGAQILPFTPTWPKLTKAVFIASGTGYWRELSSPGRRRASLLFFALVPVLVPLFG